MMIGVVSGVSMYGRPSANALNDFSILIADSSRAKSNGRVPLTADDCDFVTSTSERSRRRIRDAMSRLRVWMTRLTGSFSAIVARLAVAVGGRVGDFPPRPRSDGRRFHLALDGRQAMLERGDPVGDRRLGLAGRHRHPLISASARAPYTSHARSSAAAPAASPRMSASARRTRAGRSGTSAAAMQGTRTGTDTSTVLTSVTTLGGTALQAASSNAAQDVASLIAYLH